MSAGVVLGAVGAVAALLTTADVAPSRVPGANVRLISGPTGELAVSPTGSFLVATDLEPTTAAADSTLTIKNQTAHPVRLRVDARPVTPDLDHDLVVDVTDHGETILSERLGALRAHDIPVVLASGETRPLGVAVRLRTGASGFEGASVDVPFVIEAVRADA
ncbi:MAG TPA: hypothetical protein VF230_14965 [Acidimicrobiales bacterium]